MPVYKDGKNKWRVVYRFRNWKGELQQTQKRGFQTKREATEWMQEQMRKMRSSLNMIFGSYIERYIDDMKNRLKENTWRSKSHIIRTKILPYFKDRKLMDITPHDIIQWQNEMMTLKTKSGKPFSQDYLRSLNSQLSCLFNHAVKYYDLPSNPVKKVNCIGKKGAREMEFWTRDEYEQFIVAMMDKPISYYVFETLYWTGIRLGELLALTPADFDFENLTLRINKSYQFFDECDHITDPKTPKSNRVIDIPEFFAEEIKDYLKMLYGIQPTDRMFTITKSYLHHEMDRGSNETGVKRIRIHDIRHSHVSLLFKLGYSALEIAERLGHTSIEVTYQYAHLFPSVQKEMAEELNKLRKMKELEDANNVSEES